MAFRVFITPYCYLMLIGVLSNSIDTQQVTLLSCSHTLLPVQPLSPVRSTVSWLDTVLVDDFSDPPSLHTRTRRLDKPGPCYRVFPCKIIRFVSAVHPPARLPPYKVTIHPHTTTLPR